MIVISFNDFRKLAEENNKRIYYYKSGNILEMVYITEGIFVKSFVNLDEVGDKEIFFGQKLFIGATELLFRIPEGDDTQLNIRDIVPKPVEGDMVKENMPEETGGGVDIQKEAIQ